MEQADGTSICHAKIIYSMLLPVDPHRKSPKICIEHFYKNSDLLKRDAEGRRIYLCTEFDADLAFICKICPIFANIENKMRLIGILLLYSLHT